MRYSVRALTPENRIAEYAVEAADLVAARALATKRGDEPIAVAAVTAGSWFGPRGQARRLGQQIEDLLQRGLLEVDRDRPTHRIVADLRPSLRRRTRFHGLHHSPCVHIAGLLQEHLAKQTHGLVILLPIDGLFRHCEGLGNRGIALELRQSAARFGILGVNVEDTLEECPRLLGLFP